MNASRTRPVTSGPVHQRSSRSVRAAIRARWVLVVQVPALAGAEPLSAEGGERVTAAEGRGPRRPRLRRARRGTRRPARSRGRPPASASRGRRSAGRDRWRSGRRPPRAAVGPPSVARTAPGGRWPRRGPSPPSGRQRRTGPARSPAHSWAPPPHPRGRLVDRWLTQSGSPEPVRARTARKSLPDATRRASRTRIGGMRDLVLGFGLPVSGVWATPENVARFAVRAEELGYGSLWTYQRLLAPAETDWGPQYRSVLDPVVALAFAAAATRSARLGTAVVNAPFLPAAVLAPPLASPDL